MSASSRQPIRPTSGRTRASAEGALHVSAAMDYGWINS
jgi:hypothetical protein